MKEWMGPQMRAHFSEMLSESNTLKNYIQNDEVRRGVQTRHIPFQSPRSSFASERMLFTSGKRCRVLIPKGTGLLKIQSGEVDTRRWKWHTHTTMPVLLELLESGNIGWPCSSLAGSIMSAQSNMAVSMYIVLLAISLLRVSMSVLRSLGAAYLPGHALLPYPKVAKQVHQITFRRHSCREIHHGCPLSYLGLLTRSSRFHPDVGRD